MLFLPNTGFKFLDLQLPKLLEKGQFFRSLASSPNTQNDVICSSLARIWYPRVSSTRWDPEWQLIRHSMALCIECSPAVQKVPGLIPAWDATFTDALCRGYRWPWSSPYIVVTPTWCAFLTQRHSDLHAYVTRNRITFSLNPLSRLGGELEQHKMRSRMATNTPFEWIFA